MRMLSNFSNSCIRELPREAETSGRGRDSCCDSTVHPDDRRGMVYIASAQTLALVIPVLRNLQIAFSVKKPKVE